MMTSYVKQKITATAADLLSITSMTCTETQLALTNTAFFFDINHNKTNHDEHFEHIGQGGEARQGKSEAERSKLKPRAPRNQNKRLAAHSGGLCAVLLLTTGCV